MGWIKLTEVDYMNKFNFIEQIKGANKSIPCDLVIKNISIIDVFGQETFISDVGAKKINETLDTFTYNKGM